MNDYVVKGSVNSLNLLRLILRWSVAPVALSEGLAQFYNRCKLVNSQWNLQKFLWCPNLNPEGEIVEAIVKTLIYGVKSVSAQSEYALEQLADIAETYDKELAAFLRLCRYVDDLASSHLSFQKCLDLSQKADELFSKVGLEVKGWVYSGQDPPESVSKDGFSVSVAGSRCIPKLDAVEIKIPVLHFGKKSRGKLDENTVQRAFC